VVLHPDAKIALQTWLDVLKRSGDLLPSMPLFRSREGGNRPISREHPYRILQDGYNSNGLGGKLGTHSMHKTFADRVCEALDRDLAKLQRAMGPKHLNNAAAYISFREEEIEAAILAV
jgi:integrase